MIVVYYRERTQIKISKGKRRMWRYPGESNHKLPGVFSQYMHTIQLILPATMCDDMRKMLPIGEEHLSLGAQHFYWGHSCKHTAPQLLRFQPLRAKAEIHHRSHCYHKLSSNWYSMAQGLRHTNSLLSGRIFQRFRVYNQGTSQGPVLKWDLSWERAWFKQLISAELTLSCTDNILALP